MKKYYYTVMAAVSFAVFHIGWSLRSGSFTAAPDQLLMMIMVGAVTGYVFDFFLPKSKVFLKFIGPILVLSIGYILGYVTVMALTGAQNQIVPAITGLYFRNEIGICVGVGFVINFFLSGKVATTEAVTQHTQTRTKIPGTSKKQPKVGARIIKKSSLIKTPDSE